MTTIPDRTHAQTLNDIARAKRMRALRDAIDEPEHPFHPEVVALADQIITIDKDRPTDRSGR